MWYAAASFWLGLLSGFALGLVANAYLLRGTSRIELRQNKDLQRKFGLFNWVLAVLCALASFKLFG